MSLLHPERWLAAYCEDELAVDRRARIEAHLGRCGRCRRRVADIRRGLALARGLQPTPPPAAVESAIRVALQAAPQPSRPGLSFGWRWAAATAAAVIAALLWTGARARVTLEAAPAAVGSLEEIGLAAHRRAAAGDLALDLRSDSPAAIRGWLAARGFSAALVSQRPPADHGRFRAVGAAALDRPGLPAAAVVYTIDGLPVVLVTARQRDVADAPRWSVLGGKRVRYRETGEAQVLSWSNAGKAYALVSELPRLGRDSCLLCHADERRRQLVRQLTPPPPRI